MTWHRATSDPLTIEREVRVVNERGTEGYAAVSWELGRDHKPQLFGPVVRVERFFNEHGTEVAPPRRTVIDANPTYA